MKVTPLAIDMKRNESAHSVIVPALQYLGLTFAAGFALGIVRTLWLVPYVGERTAELIELPMMVLVSFVAADFVVRRRRSAGLKRRIAIGVVALLVILSAELGFVALVRNQTPADSMASRDPVAGVAYLLALLMFAAAPALLMLIRRVPESRGA